jgi:hypothetical protein
MQEFSNTTPPASFAVITEQMSWDHHPYRRSFHMKDEEPIVKLPYLRPANLPRTLSLYEHCSASKSYMWDVTLRTVQKEEAVSLKYCNNYLGMLS